MYILSLSCLTALLAAQPAVENSYRQPVAPSVAQTSAAAPSLDDATIFAIFDEANSVDIWTARLGVRNAHSPEVRALAGSVASEHEQVQQLLRDLARKLAIVPVPPVADRTAHDHATTLALLQKKSGADFDRAYLQHEIQFHATVIKSVKETLLPAIHNEEFHSLVQTILPGLEHHLAETTAVAEHLGYR